MVLIDTGEVLDGGGPVTCSTANKSCGLNCERLPPPPDALGRSAYIIGFLLRNFTFILYF